MALDIWQHCRIFTHFQKNIYMFWAFGKTIWSTNGMRRNFQTITYTRNEYLNFDICFTVVLLYVYIYILCIKCLEK